MPWLIAEELLQAAQRRRAHVLPLILATGSPLELRIGRPSAAIDVDELHKGQLGEPLRFRHAAPVSPIFTALDSLMLKPGDDALRREQFEGVTPVAARARRTSHPPVRDLRDAGVHRRRVAREGIQETERELNANRFAAGVVRVLFVRDVGDLGRFRIGVLVLNSQPHFFAMYRSSFGRFDPKMNLATSNLEHLQARCRCRS